MIWLRLLLVMPAILAMAIGGSLYPLWFALALYVLTSTGAEFLKRRDARSVIGLSGALGAVQVFTPLGGFLVAGVLPALAGFPRNRTTLGLYAVLLFVPVLIAALLLFVSSAQISPAAMVNVNWQPSVHLDALKIPVLEFPVRMALDVAVAIPFLPLLFLADRAQRKWPATLGGVLLGASLIATYLGSVLDSWTLFGGYAAIIAVSFAPPRQTHEMARDA